MPSLHTQHTVVNSQLKSTCTMTFTSFSFRWTHLRLLRWFWGIALPFISTCHSSFVVFQVQIWVIVALVFPLTSQRRMWDWSGGMIQASEQACQVSESGWQLPICRDLLLCPTEITVFQQCFSADISQRFEHFIRNTICTHSFFWLSADSVFFAFYL